MHVLDGFMQVDRLLYLKPVQTGYPTDTDAGMIAHVAGIEESVGAHAGELLSNGSDGQRSPALYSKAHRYAHTEFAWRLAASPHLSVESEGATSGALKFRYLKTTAHLEHSKFLSQFDLCGCYVDNGATDNALHTE
eukprot:4371164-Pyramimonas_sp.AAC.1